MISFSMLRKNILATFGRTIDDAGLTDELNRMTRIELGERLERAGDSRPRGKVAAHGVQRDPGQGYASRAATRCSPA